MATGGSIMTFWVIFGSLPVFLLFLYLFSSHLEAPIKTEADILVEDEVLHNNTPKRSRNNVKVTVKNYRSPKKSFKKTNPKRKKDYHNYHTLFEPRTHHPYLLEMVSDFSLHSDLSFLLRWWSQSHWVSAWVHACMLFNFTKDLYSLKTYLCILILKLHLAYSWCLVNVESLHFLKLLKMKESVDLIDKEICIKVYWHF